jgi:AsmA protein
MQEIDTTRESTRTDQAILRPDPGEVLRKDPSPRRRWLTLFHWRYVVVYLILIGLALLAVLPPLVNVSRYKRRIVTSISTSIGRPVHLDNVSLVLLPFPGFKLENFVVEEAPAFGAEPVIHANNVVATLRFSSLWRRKVEFSKISLEEPSINLVHMPPIGLNPGHWNVESILLQAARIPAAPTAQAKAGYDPRFPYIEATDARINIKYGNEKLPLSLTEADLALWLPRPQQWRIRIEGKPTRTDTSASDTGTISLEGTLNRAERFDLIPIDLSGEWKNAPLGEASRVITGRDAGLRGELRLNVTIHGTIGESQVKTLLQLRGARRADFVPPRSLELRAECQAAAAETFHAFHQIRCSWRPPVAESQLAMTANLADIHDPSAATFEIGTPGLAAATLLDWLRVVSPRVSPDVAATGTLTGSLTREAAASGNGIFSGHLRLSGGTLAGGSIGDSAVALGDVTIASTDPARLPARPTRGPGNRREPKPVTQPVAGEFMMAPATLALGGKEPALLEGRFDPNGYSFHLYGNVLPSRLLALAWAIPQFGDGLKSALSANSSISASPTKELPIHIDLTSTRLWGGEQIWTKTPAKPVKAASARRR